MSNSCPNDYRFGFNGQEKDREIYNNESTTTAMFWEYDGRIGRRWNLDPEPQVNMSDYSCFGNNPISMVDPLGNSKDWVEKTDASGNKSSEWDKDVTSKDDKDLKSGDKYLGKLGTEVAADGTIDILRSNGTRGKGLMTLSTFKFDGGKMSEHARTISNPGAKSVYEGQAAFMNSPATKIGVALMAAPFAFSGGLLASSEFMFGKAVISAGTQAILNKGNIDILDVGLDATLAPGAGLYLGGVADVTPFGESKFSWIGGNKSLGQAGLDIATGSLSGKIGNCSYSKISPFLKNTTEKTLMNTVISFPSSVIGGGFNTVIKNNLGNE